jgi:hypothetical protein
MQAFGLLRLAPTCRGRKPPIISVTAKPRLAIHLGGKRYLRPIAGREYSVRQMANGKSLTDSIREALLGQLGISGESLQKIKLGRGAVGKIAVISVAALITIAAVGFKVSGTPSVLTVVAVLGLVALSALGCVLYVIVKQPEIAVLEGAELVLYKHVTLGVKGQPSLPANAIPIPEPPALPADEGEGK